MANKEKTNYDSITEAMLPEKGTEDYNDFQLSLEKDGVFQLTPLELLRDEKFGDDHMDCQRCSDGMPRFGAIGGGMSITFIIPENGMRRVVSRCDGCEHEYDITEGNINGNEYDAIVDDNVPDEPEEKADYLKKIYWGRTYSMNEVEYLRFMKFKEDYAGVPDKGDLMVTFRGTGLGNLVSVRYSNINTVYDITDCTHW